MNKNYYKIALISLLIIFTISLAVSAESSAQDPLWLKALKIMEANQDWEPGHSVIRTEEFDKHGQSVAFCTVKLESTAQEDGSLKNQVTDVTFNGGAVTDENRKQAEKLKNSPLSTKPVTYNPVQAGFEAGTEITRVAEPKVIHDQTCVGFEFSQLSVDHKPVHGTAWIAKETGVPVQIDYYPTTLPSFIGKMLLTFDYTYTEAGEWYPLESYMSISVNLLFIKKSIEIVSTYQDYFRL